MVETLHGVRQRKLFGRIPEILPVPNLIAVQRDSYAWFLDEGLKDIFTDITPIEDFTGNLAVEFGAHSFGEAKYDVEECKEKDMTFSAPLFVEVRFINRETGEIKEQTVFMGDFPLMTDKGTFVINGTERVVVSQLVRSPGVYFDRELDKTSDKELYFAKMIPSRGAWLEFETDKRDVIGVRIDRKRKQPATVLLRALGGIAQFADRTASWAEDEQLLAMFQDSELIKATLERDHTRNSDEALI
ncbi:MAG: DNA-directed RNA polymerase subunit beta, partial [Candidatus Geothermincolia bacterium]